MRKATAIRGVREMAIPVTFAIITTVAAFAPLLFVSGTMGKIMRQIPIVVIAVLVMSLVEALLILPAHLAGENSFFGRFVKPLISRLESVQGRVQNGLERLIQGPYRKTLEVALEWRYATIVGASKEESVDVRILSATHRNLSKMVAAGDFREDLFYRINVIELRVPALRERGDDVLLLADHILERLGAHGALDDSARTALLQYGFPGNVRELENMLERAVTLRSDGRISATDLHMRGSAVNRGTGRVPGGNLGDHVEDVQRQAIVEALEKTRYNKTAAARLLGLSFRQLRYRIKKLGIE